MHIAIVAATEGELAFLTDRKFSRHQISCQVHGAGMIPAMYHLQQICAQKPELIIQTGIAGAYSPELRIGDTVLVSRDRFDHGAEDAHHLLDLFDIGLAEKDQPPYSATYLPCPATDLCGPHFRRVDALTVSVAGGNAQSIAMRRKKYAAQIETMEGAALHYTGLMTQIPFLQIRSISNYVEIRNRANWDIPLALANNASAIHNLIEQL